MLDAEDSSYSHSGPNCPTALVKVSSSEPRGHLQMVQCVRPQTARTSFRLQRAFGRGNCVIRRRSGETSGDLKLGVKRSMSGCRLFSRRAAAVAAAATAARASRVPRVFTATHRPLHTSLRSCSFAKELFLGKIEQVRQVLAALVLCFCLSLVPGRSA